MRHRTIDWSALRVCRCRLRLVSLARAATSAAGCAALTLAGVPSVRSAVVYGPCFSGDEEEMP